MTNTGELTYLDDDRTKVLETKDFSIVSQRNEPSLVNVSFPTVCLIF